ncbi:hypothetical protein CBL_12337 [Carabus blaptoides fortunei]
MSAEIVEYCVSDVDILRRACVKFRKAFINDRGVCPFTEAVTIASACSKVFRRRFLKPRTIGLIPSGGYRMRDTQSRVALEWLIWEEETRQIRREAVLDGGLKVDGYYAPTKLVFEFHGCFYHGHNLCFRTKRDDPILNNPHESLNSRFDRTVAKTKKLRELGLELFASKYTLDGDAYNETVSVFDILQWPSGLRHRRCGVQRRRSSTWAWGR